MFFNSTNFKTIEAGLKHAALKQEVHTQNMSNLETPGYKAKNLVFEQLLTDAKKGSATFRATLVENKNLSTRPDGNNVDMEKESLELYKAYVQHSMLVDKVKNEFSNYSTVVNNNMK